MATRPKAGQPTKYTPELARKICQLISTHPFGLSTLIRMYNLPDRQTIYNWLNTYQEFFDSYMNAKREQAHVLADEMLEVHYDIPVYEDKEGNSRIDAGMLGRAKLQMDALRWSAGKLAPKWYGDSKSEESKINDIHEDVMKRKQELDKRNKKDY